MNEALDSGIQELFDAARNEARDDAFVAEVMARVNAQRRRTLILWSLVGVVLLAVAALLSGPVTDAVSVLTQVIPRPLVDAELDNALVSQVLAPLNSVAAVVGLGALMLAYSVRKMFGRR